MTTPRFFDNVPTGLNVGDSAAEQRLLREYGAVFVAQRVLRPEWIIFPDHKRVVDFQSRTDVASFHLGGFELELQRPAADALLAAAAEAKSRGLSVSPRGADSARRDYADTVELWRSRVEPALTYWESKGKLTKEETSAIRSMKPNEQVAVVFELEKKEIWFAKDLSKSIIYSVAPPGASQHLSMLAFDVAEFDDPRVREILARHQWYQTVVSDLPHFTFLGAEANTLAGLGLKRLDHLDLEFWVPDI